jgi:hypothetical protein
MGAFAPVRNALACVLAGALGIAALQPGLARNIHKLHQRDDVFLLPPPRELRAMTLGYRAAATDLLWAKLILEYGVHFQEKRAFPDVTRYIDGILSVEPDFQTLYLYVDTLLVWTSPAAHEEDARKARSYLERGTRERPYDPEVWLHYGQFTAFLAPSFLKSEAEIQQWRKDGALAIMRAVELGADADRSLAASTILRKSGDRDANIKFLERAYAMTDDPETRQQILYKMKMLDATSDAEISQTAIERECRARWRFLTRGECLLVGPARSAATCAGPLSFARDDCPRSWQAFVDHR